MVLTLDEKIQYIAQRELAAAIAKTHALAGTVVVMNPNNGELLAVANWPTFDPNVPIPMDAGGKASKDAREARVDRAVTIAYEPGSTFKLITLAGAFDQGLIRADEVFDCENGATMWRGTRFTITSGLEFDGGGDFGAVQRCGSDQDCGAVGGAEIQRLHSLIWIWLRRPESICREKAAGCCGRWRIGRRFRLARFPWGRKWE